MPGDSGVIVVMLVCVLPFYMAHEPADASGIRHSLRPLFRGANDMHNSGASRAAGMRSHIRRAVIARSTCDEAIQSFRFDNAGLLRFARNDVDRPALSTVIARLDRAIARSSWATTSQELVD